MDLGSEGARLQRLAWRALERIRAAGCSGEVSVSADESFSVRVRESLADKVEFLRGQSMTLAVYHGDSKGVASTSDLSESAVDRLVESACAIARLTQPDPCNGLAEAAQMAQDIVDLELWHPSSLSIQDALAMAMEGDACARAYPGVDRCESFSVSSGNVLKLYANTHGLMVLTPASRHGMGCSVIASDGGHMVRDGYGLSERQWHRLPPVSQVAEEAARRAVARRGAQKLPTSRLPVLFSPDMAVGLFGHLISAISGGALFRNASFLKDSLGTSLLPRSMNIREVPRELSGYASSCIDGDGLSTRSQHFILEGEVVRYVLGTYSARKLGMAATANSGGVRNVRVEGLCQPIAALIGSISRGLLVTELMGQGVNLVTGDYSRGAAGFLIESGEIRGAVHEVTVAGNLKQMYSRITGLGDDIDRRGNLHTGSVLIEGMTVAGR